MAELTKYIFTQFFDNDGDPLSSGTVTSKDAGTANDKDTFNAADGLTANANPIVLDSAGRADIFLEQGTYDFTLKDSLGNTIDQKLGVDGAIGSGATSVQLVENIAGLRALTAGSSDYVDIGGYYADGDGGVGRFYWVAGSGATDNNGTIITPDSAPPTGRWFRIFDLFVKVEWFGTVGDGVTDDTASFLSAAAICQNKELQLGSTGNTSYLITAAIPLQQDCTVRNIGKGLITSTNTAGVPDGFHIFGAADGCKFYDLEATGSAVDKAGYNVINTTGADNLIIERCKSTGYGEFINIESSNDVLVNDCMIDGTNRWSINIADSNQVIISNNIVDGSTTSDGIKVNGNTYVGGGSLYFNSDNITIKNNICTNNARDGIDLASDCDTVLIQGNNCKGNTLNGIECKLVSGATSATRIFVEDNACINNTVHGIRMDDVSRSHVTGNNVDINGDEGILVQNNILKCRVSDNLIQGNAGNGIRFEGSLAVGTSIDNVISNNRCIDNGTGDNGIGIGDYVDELVVQGNSCYQTSAGKTNSGIAITGTTTISNIIIKDNFCPQDKLDNSSDQPISMGSFNGDNVLSEGNVTYSNGVFPITDGDTTPSVAGGNPVYQTGNTAPTSITGFDKNSFEVGSFKVLVLDTNTTFVNSGTFVLRGGVNYTALNGAVMTFICRNNIFREISRIDSNGGLSADTTITNDLTVGNDVSVSGSLTLGTASEKILVENAFSLEHAAGAAATSEMTIKSKANLDLHIDFDGSTADRALRILKDNSTILFSVNETGNVDIVVGGLDINAGFGMNNVGIQTQQSHIADPSGGGTIDAEARTAIDAILVILETFGFTATS